MMAVTTTAAEGFQQIKKNVQNQNCKTAKNACVA
jgi:hypothetical protein